MFVGGVPVAALAARKLASAVVRRLLCTGQSSDNFSATPLAANDVSDGYIDLDVTLSFVSLSAQQGIFSKFRPGGGSTDRAFQFGTYSGGLYLAWVDGSGYYSAQSSSMATAGVPLNAPVHVRVRLNVSTGTLNGLAAGSAIFSYSLDGVTYTQIGAVVTGLTTAGINQIGTAYPPMLGSSAFSNFTGSIYKLVMLSASGVIRYNPDLTKLSARQTGTFIDTAATPNTWTINGTIA